MSNVCYRCKQAMDAPDLQEMIHRELDWRVNWIDSFEGDEEDRVLICADCAEEIDIIED